MDYTFDGVHAFLLDPPLLVTSAEGFGTTGRPVGQVCLTQQALWWQCHGKTSSTSTRGII